MSRNDEREDSPWRSLWTLPDDVSYLNHGSFGPSPRVVQESFLKWSGRLESQPMNFFLREMEPAFEEALSVLAKFVGTSRSHLVFVDNATFGMNVVARSVELDRDDEVLVTDHEYGAVTRLWKRRCQEVGARVVTQELPSQFVDRDEVARQFQSGVTPETRLIVVSHVTSQTALILPVEEICRQARERGIPVCIDGPHAVGMLPLNLKKLDCDFYTASCHKWLSAPFGSGFLYVAPRQQKRVQPAIVSWGGSIGGRQRSWKDEFNWLGTRNPAALLATADAIRFLESDVDQVVDQTSEHSRSKVSLTTSRILDRFVSHSRAIVREASEKLSALTDQKPLTADLDTWCGAMVSLPLPTGDSPPMPGHQDPLQKQLWERHRIEIPVIHWNGRRLLRVSGHLYNSSSEIHQLESVLETELD